MPDLRGRSVMPVGAVTFAVLSVAALVACTATDRPTHDPSSTLTTFYSGGSDHFIITPQGNMSPQHLVYSGLFEYDQNGETTPGLVRAWEHSDDFRVWTYHLRTDVRWHDGVSFTAHDVKFTYDLYGHPAVTRIDPAAQTITVLDDSTFTMIRLKNTRDPLDAWRVYLPRHLLEELDPENLWEWEYWNHPVGTGPYRHLRHDSKSWVELEANPDFYQGKPAIERIVLRFGGNPVVELESGNVDATSDIGFSDAVRLSEGPRFQMYWRATSALTVRGAVWWNHRNPIFRDVEVRRALTHSVDRESLAAVLNYPPEFPLLDFPVTYAQILRKEVPEPFPYDPELAGQLLDRAGWRDLDGDGIRERGGEKLRFSLLIDGPGEPTAVFLQDQYRRVGAEVEIETVVRSVLIQRLHAGSFEAAIGGGGGGRFYSILLGEEGSPGAGYQSPELEGILATKDSSFDPLAEEQANRAMWSIYRRDVPVTPLLPSPVMGIAHVRVKGLRSPDRVWPDRHAQYLWIEEGG